MFEKEKILLDIPILMVCENIEKAVDKGCIFFFHGLFGSKEENINELRELAKDGFLVIGIDNYGHGKRKMNNLEKVISSENKNVEQDFLNLVIKTADELTILINELIKQKFIKTENIAVAGISMGAYITYTAITKDPRIKVAVSIVGSPKYKLDLDESPHKKIEKFNKIKLLSQNAEKDTIVLSEATKKFHNELKKIYSDYDKRFRYIEYLGAEHMMGQEDFDKSIEEMRNWFKKYL